MCSQIGMWAESHHSLPTYLLPFLPTYLLSYLSDSFLSPYLFTLIKGQAPEGPVHKCHQIWGQEPEGLVHPFITS